MVSIELALLIFCCILLAVLSILLRRVFLQLENLRYSVQDVSSNFQVIHSDLRRRIELLEQRLTFLERDNQS